MKKFLLLFLVLFVSLNSVNAERVEYFNGVKNLYVDKVNNSEVKFICDSLNKNEYVNQYVSSRLSSRCSSLVALAKEKSCYDEMLKLYEQALCTSKGASAKANLIRANQILQKHPSWKNAFIWQSSDDGHIYGCGVAHIPQLVNKVGSCR